MENKYFRTVAARVIAVVLDYGCRARYQIEVRGLEDCTHSPSTLVVYNHRRDADTPIIGNILFARRGLLEQKYVPTFIAREDLFKRGFFADYLEDWPAPIARLLSPISVRPALWALRAYPMRRIAERTLGEVLADVMDVFGDLPLHEVLRPRWVGEFARLARLNGRPLRLSHVLRPQFRPLLRQGYGLTKLNHKCFRAFKPYERKTIESQMRVFVETLENGGSVQMAPEGAVSKDGHFARVRAGLHILINRPRTLVRVLPVGMAYDFMTSGRQRLFVNLGQEMLDLRGLKPSVTSAKVAEAILAQTTITGSQLASKLLAAARTSRGATVTKTELDEYVAVEASRWAGRGLYVDPRLLSRKDRRVRLAEYVEYCLRSGELVALGGERYWVPPSKDEILPSWAHPAGAIDYLNNELASLSHVLLGTQEGAI